MQAVAAVAATMVAVAVALIAASGGVAVPSRLAAAAAQAICGKPVPLEEAAAPMAQLAWVVLAVVSLEPATRAALWAGLRAAVLAALPASLALIPLAITGTAQAVVAALPISGVFP